MKANNRMLVADCLEDPKMFFRIPVYQRNYKWSEIQCKKLLDDLETILFQLSEKPKKHFLGIIVLICFQDYGSAGHIYDVIDGQQRLTTLLIVLKALSDCLNKEDSLKAQLEKIYKTEKSTSTKNYKLKSQAKDFEQFNGLVEDKIDALNVKGRIYLNYLVCKERIEIWLEQSYQAEFILKALRQLEIVEIILDQNEDDPQVIFESINSTGLILSTPDLIRNYLLMGQAEQNRLYEKYWLIIEEILKPSDEENFLQDFFMNYMFFKTNSIIKKEKLYEEFVNFCRKGNNSIEEKLQELVYYAKIFAAFVQRKSQYSMEIKERLKNIYLLQQTTIYPFLFHLFDDYHRKILVEAALIQILDFLFIYLLRRIVCGVVSNRLRKLFIVLYDHVFRISKNKEKYYLAIKKYLFSGTNIINQIPSDQQFYQALLSKNLYRLNVCKFLLIELENCFSKEKMRVENLTIEHIMPQTLDEQKWGHINQKDHKIYLHVLGNLTLSGINQELSNQDFVFKKKKLEQLSRIKFLNQDVLNKEQWDIACIIARSKRLAKAIVKRYQVEIDDDEDIEFEPNSFIISLDDLKKVTHTKPLSFTFENQTYQQDSYISILFDIIRLFEKKQPGIFEQLARKEFCFRRGKKGHADIAFSSEKMRCAKNIKDINSNIYIETNLSALAVMSFIKKLFVQYQADINCFSMRVVRNSK